MERDQMLGRKSNLCRDESPAWLRPESPDELPAGQWANADLGSGARGRRSGKYNFFNHLAFP